MTQPAKAAEPSMEEILASIRRIIADDEPAQPAPSTAPELPPRPAAVAPLPSPEPLLQAPVPPPVEIPAPAAQPSDEVLELTEAMTAPAIEPTIGFRTIDGQTDLIFDDSSDQLEPPAREPEPPPARRQPAAEESVLISSTTSEAVDSAFNSLAHTVLVQNARTLEDIVREMLRPMLKGWLDQHLPAMVERLVRAEIERVSRGRG